MEPKRRGGWYRKIGPEGCQENGYIRRTKELIFQYLHHVQDVQQVRMKEIRNHLEKEMFLPRHTFKTDKYKYLLEIFATQYFSEFKKTSLNHPLFYDAPQEDNDEEHTKKVKKGKWSITEKKIVLRALYQYAAEKEISIQELHPYYKEDKKWVSHPVLYDRLLLFLPHRTRTVSSL
jgi:hypothetical protein